MAYPIFAISTSTPDYTNIELLAGNEEDARKQFEEEIEDRDDETNYALFKITGPGSIYLGIEASGSKKVECLEDTVWL